MILEPAVAVIEALSDLALHQGVQLSMAGGPIYRREFQSPGEDVIVTTIGNLVVNQSRLWTTAISPTSRVDRGESNHRQMSISRYSIAIRNHFVPSHQKHSALAIHIHRIRAIAQSKAVTGAAA